MTATTTLPQTGQLDAAGLRQVLVILCLTEITSWGVLYYAFPVLTVSISHDTGWSMPVVVAAFSLSQLAAALTGIPVGRIIDNIGPRAVMSGGSLLAVAALPVVATAPNLPVFYAGWIAAGIAMGAVLYPPAFAALTRWHGDGRVTALMILTLAGGLASTVFAPLTGTLVQHLDWRTTYLILTAILAAITVPAHWWGLRVSWPPPPTPAHGVADNDHTTATHSAAFLALVVSLSLGAFAASAAVFTLVPLLIERGFSPAFAALTLGIGGAGQVLGRVGYLPLATRTTARTRLAGILAATAATTVLLGIATTTTALIGVSIGAGSVRGIFTLVQATAITDRWGATRYGRLHGLMTAPIVIVMALAPWAGTALSSATGSYAHTYLALGAVALVSAGIATVSIPAISHTTTTSTTCRHADRHPGPARSRSPVVRLRPVSTSVNIDGCRNRNCRCVTCPGASSPRWCANR